MLLTVHQNTVRLIEAFQSRYPKPLYDSGKSKSNALDGALMLVNAYLDDEKTGNTILQVGETGREWPTVSMKNLFAAAAARKNPNEGNISVKTSNDLQIGSIHKFLKEQKILDAQSTAGDALNLAMIVAHDLTSLGPLALRTPKKEVVGRMVFI